VNEPAAQPIAVIGAPLDLGQDRRGVDMGPSAIRYAGLDRRLEELGRRVEDWGNVPAPVAEAVIEGDELRRFL
jgi:arginase